MIVEPEDYHIRPYRPGDEEAIINLFSQVFGGQLSREQWRWKYTATGSSPLAWLGFDASECLIGHAGAIPLRGWRQGRSVPFFQICDVMVHPEARGQLGGRNLFTQLARGLLNAVGERWPDAFAYGFPGERPFRLGEYARIYGKVEQAHALYRPTHSGWLPPIIRVLDWHDARLDPLWSRLAANFTLALIRDRDYLHWRYATNPFHAYRLLGFQIGTRLLGWAVVRREEQRLLIVDLLLRRCGLRLALALLDRLAAREGLDTVIIWLPYDWRQTTGKPAEPTGVMVANMLWALSMTTAEVQRTLYYSMGDLDIF